jgi:hypothetical protein
MKKLYPAFGKKILAVLKQRAKHIFSDLTIEAVSGSQHNLTFNLVKFPGQSGTITFYDDWSFGGKLVGVDHFVGINTASSHGGADYAAFTFYILYHLKLMNIPLNGLDDKISKHLDFYKKYRKEMGDIFLIENQ